MACGYLGAPYPPPGESNGPTDRRASLGRADETSAPTGFVVLGGAALSALRQDCSV